MKKISVITVNYNNASGLLKTVESVLGQESNKFEYIIIDGGSTDGSVALLQKKSNEIAYWVSENDSGIYNAMNKGIKRASGEYLMFLNSGDFLVDSKVLSKCSELLDMNTDVDVLYGDILMTNITGGLTNEVYYKHPSVLDLKYLLQTTINHQASLIKSSLFKEFGLYPEYYKLASDYWLFLTSFLKSKKYYHFAHAIVKYDMSGISAADNYKDYRVEKKAIWEMLVPDYAKLILEQNEELEQVNRSYKHLLNYKMVKLAVAFVKFRSNINRVLFHQ